MMTLMPSVKPKARLSAGFSRTDAENDHSPAFVQDNAAMRPSNRLTAEVPMAVSRAGAPKRIAMNAAIGRKTRRRSMLKVC